MSAARPFSDRVASQLRLTDHRLRTSQPGSARNRYAICRMTISVIAPVDSFYIAFFHGDETLVIPYCFDHDRQLDPTVCTFGKDGLSHWVRSSGRPYVFADDDGALLGRTIAFGNVDEISMDAVIVPLRDAETGEVNGLMSVQSLRPNVYDQETVDAAQWIGDALMLAQARDRHTGADPNSLYAVHPELNSAISPDRESRFIEITTQLGDAGNLAGKIAQVVAEHGDQSLVREVTQLRLILEQVQVDVAEWMLAKPTEELTEQAAPRIDLTPREMEIATMIATDALTNSQIAETLQISLKTVKTHVGNILAKLGVGQRSAIVFAMADLLATSPAAAAPQGPRTFLQTSTSKSDGMAAP